MTGKLPPAPDEKPAAPASAMVPWAQIAPSPSVWPATVAAGIAILLSVAALVVALTSSTEHRSAPSPATSSTPPNSAEESTAARNKVCGAYNVAARAVQIATNGDNPALSGVALVNGAVILEHAVESTRGLSSSDRAAALTLAEAYSNAQAIAPTVQQRSDPSWQLTINDVNTKDAVMKKICGENARR